MSISRIVHLVLLWSVLVLVGRQLVPSPGLLLDLPILAYVLALPAIGAFACHGPGALLSALRDAFAARPDDLPPERRASSAAVLRDVGGLCLAAGVIGFMGALIATFSAIANAQAQVSSNDLLASLPGMVIAPLYGLAFDAFLFRTLARALEGAETGLAAALDGPTEEK